MPLLALDTSAAQCAAALLSDDGTLTEIVEPMAKGQAERLLPLAQDILDSAATGWDDLDALAVGIGPGNFTGIRIAVSAVRGLALGLDIPAIGVSGFAAHAHVHGTPCLIALDARRDRAYVQGYGLDTLADPTLMTLDGLTALDLPSGVAVLSDIPDLAARWPGARIAPVGPAPIAAIAQVARAKGASPGPPPAPLYLRPADAALPATPPVVILDDA